MKLDILYFARLKDSFGMGNEQLDTEAASVDELLIELRQRGGNWSSELAAGKAFRVARNQELVRLDATLSDGDEVAIFPPVTGG
ncbi:molybdenum cofactor biosynthesis protein MoaD [Aquitalea magnusonii]|uniref:MoaD/ThiS family protein n=1 Tax=Aquitalea TaxID=407217 RepID=UPI0005F801B1|nr:MULTISPECIES: MoaD/ThiS family protein [Aquitalea]KJV31748.1 molybdenum cofactor biosynthesis protein MoaD [Aquitalea magnusonii]